MPVAAQPGALLHQGVLRRATPVAPPPAEEQTAPADVEEVKVPSAADRHLLSRFSFGVTPSLVAASEAAGGARRWFGDQLEPADIPDGEAAALASWWPTLGDSFAKKHADCESGHMLGFEQDYCLARWTLMHRITTRRQVLAVMTDFWSNLLFVHPNTKTFQWRADFEHVIRAKALTTFTEVLTAAALHPAMLVFLDNARSTADHPNENLGRELLELHTVGREANFSEREVKDSMRILTGFRVQHDGACQPYYSDVDHATGPVSVLGFEHPNGDPHGEPVAWSSSL